MASILDLLTRGPTVSVELWPPRTPEATERLRQAMDELSQLRPAFASITYGAGGSTRGRTHDLVLELHANGTIVPMAHLTCVAHARSELEEILERYRAAGIENLLALRGDLPAAAAEARDGDLVHAIELVQLAKARGGFCVAVAAHPHGHPEATDSATDLDHLAAKLEVADLGITQFLYSADEYLRLRDALAKRGVDRPLLAGVMPITGPRTLTRMAELCGVPVPDALAREVAVAGEDLAAVREIGVEIATELCGRLLAEGAGGLHFYTMNQIAATAEICSRLGLNAPN